MVWPAQSLEHNLIDVDNLIIWYVRSSCQTNTTCEKRFGKQGQISLECLSKMPKVCKAMTAADGQFFEEGEV